MRWNSKRLPLFRVHAAWAYWRRSNARPRWRSYGLSRYPWPLQLAPRFVFAVFPARRPLHQAMWGRTQSAGRRRMNTTLQRRAEASKLARAPRLAEGPGRGTALVRKGGRAAAVAAQRVRKPPQAFRARRTTRFARAPGALERARARMRAPQAAVATSPRRARLRDFGDRLSSHSGARFVAQDRRAAPGRAPARSRQILMRGAADPRARGRSGDPTARLLGHAQQRRSAAAMERRTEEAQRRPMVSAPRSYRFDRLRNRRAFDSVVSLLRAVPRRSKGERVVDSARSATRRSIRECVLMIFRRDRAVATEAVRFRRDRFVANGSVRPNRAAVIPAVKRARDRASPRVATFANASHAVRAIAARVAGTTRTSLGRERRTVVAFAQRLVRRTASSRRQRFIFARQRPQRYRSAFGGARHRGEHIAEPSPLVLRQHAGSARSADRQRAAPRQAFVVREPRRAIPASSNEPAPQPQSVPVIEEVRRILIPLLQDTLFSQGTMGRLADGVLTEAGRRDSAEQYRKSGGR